MSEASFVTHLECSLTGKTYEAGKVHGLSEAGKPLLVRYDLEALGKAVSKRDLLRRTEGFWRYHEFLPVAKADNRVSLGEVVTPLIRTPRIEAKLGGGDAISTVVKSFLSKMRKDDPDKRGGFTDAGGTTWWIATMQVD